MTEVEKLNKTLEEEGIRIGGITPGSGLEGLSEEERQELIAKEINKVLEDMKDPVKNLISRIYGEIFSMKDYIMCAEGCYNIIEDRPVPPSEEEKNTIRRFRQIIALFEESVEMMKTLNEGKSDRG